MELEFDKEIDAILRKAREPVGIAVTSASPAHLDADAVAAFAENALPPKARLLYMEHFADCGGCRKMLSQTILTNTGADATTAFSSAAQPVVKTAESWYSKFFRTPNLALAMGALVLAFSGVLGYLALQNRSDSTNSTVSQVTDQEEKRGGPYNNGDVSAMGNAANTMVAANSAAPAANAAAIPSAVSNTASNSPVDPAGRGSATGSGKTADGYCAECGSPDDVSEAKPKPIAEPPPAPAAEKPSATRNEKEAGSGNLKDEEKADGRSKQNEDRMARDSVPPAQKKTGPNRAGGPRQTTLDNVMNQSVAGMITGTKTAGGKTFENSNGIWYDRAYNGQKTTNVRRGTDTYKKLDSGLRAIAESIGGTVIVVWKEKAYRIQ
ncbi:MAG: hypothetical protein ACKVQJ_15215 [Pyrinomonadaceae bacterium]